MTIKSEFLIVAQQVFDLEQRPMTPKEIVDIAVKERLFSDKRAGKTPHQTMKSKLSVHIRRNGEKSPFVRTGPGRFFLRKLLASDQAPYHAHAIAKPQSTERVLVFESSWLDGHRRFQGIQVEWERFYNDLFSKSVCRHMSRAAAETANVYKQVLTYIMVTRSGSVLAYRRGNYNRVEDFLRGAECIGFGGHVSSDDNRVFSSYDKGVTESVIRELMEELRLPKKDVLRLAKHEGLSCVGVLNDDSSTVGQRHIAFLFKYEVSDAPEWDKPERGEKSITQLRWLSSKDAAIPIWRFEYWSQLCFREYFPQLVSASPSYQIRRRRPLYRPHLLCIIGAVGSGKSEATRLLCKEYGYREINTGKIVAELLDLPPIPETSRKDFQERSLSFISRQDGPLVLAQQIWKCVNELGSDKVLIDGLRQRRTLECLKNLASSVRIGLLFVHTLPDLAYKFYMEREVGKRIGNITEFSIFDFLNVRNAKVEAEVEGMISLSDAVLYNWIGLNEYKKALRSLMQDISDRGK